MATADVTPFPSREPELVGQTVVVIGGSAGIGLEDRSAGACRGRRCGLDGPQPRPPEEGGQESAQDRSAAFDATDQDSLEQLFSRAPAPVGHVMVTAGAPRYGRPPDMAYDGGARRSTGTCS